MSKIITGTLDAFFETGTEGVIWSIIEDGKDGYDGLNPLRSGDYLSVFDKAGNLIWEGNVSYNYTDRYQSYPLNPQYGQQAVNDMWVHGLQNGVIPEDWALWFTKGYRAVLARAGLEHSYSVKSSTILEYSWSGSFIKGESGDLVIRFKNDKFYRYKDVPSNIFMDFASADSKGKYFATNIKDRFITEKIELPNNSMKTNQPKNIPSEVPVPDDYDDYLEWTPAEEEEFLKILNDKGNDEYFN